MFERISLKLVGLITELKREEGQGATEYAMIIVFLILILGAGLGVLGGGINAFLGEVATELGDLIP
jgi:Flp pilus assembly pilin Flp